jgi:membrane dipeptidase
MTLTHSCNNAFADSAGIFEAVKPIHGGLSKLGRVLVQEMNRVGVIVDVSHVSDDTARQAISLSRAPVMWSHSAVRAYNNISRNVPDELLKMVREDEGRDGVVMVNFAPYFVKDGGNATVEDVADHVEHIAKIAGRDRVGMGSDFDGVGPTLPKGLEDVSKYPVLVSLFPCVPYEDSACDRKGRAYFSCDEAGGRATRV